ncbi:squamosa promoter-binding-like protein 1 isoform X1 [Ipomoea triloba]|uniref:squamosa promoter-binding-like protein 1 isoform X1 n=1 Tax=Ipomoea triloba TaxID=35885 RepID=UPI00125CE185|nr:squamosa promoter-binding-like protein 1 isoform X1 [Ipomoea triloba]
MESRIGGKGHHLYGPVIPDLKAVGKRSMEWDLNDWKWDGDMFLAVPLNCMPSDCRSRQLFPDESQIPANNGVPNGSDEVVVLNEKGKKEMEKRRRLVVVEQEDLNECASLNLKLGGQVFPITEEEMEKGERKNGKKTKVAGGSSNRAVCQVEDCQMDLTNSKDYHRRHKVCEVHSKATKALVGNAMQRFCQQCSRFHALQEFDEGKRSCRRRLAGHNSRRRKTHPENVPNGAPMNDERGTNYLLISLLRILANMHGQTNSSDQTKDQDILSHLLRNLASLAGSNDERNLSGPLPTSQDLHNAGTSAGSPEKDSHQLVGNSANLPTPEVLGKSMAAVNAAPGISQNPSTQPELIFPRKDCTTFKAISTDNLVRQKKLHNIDLNNVYDDSQDCMGVLKSSDHCQNPGNISSGCPLWVCQDPHKSTSTRTSGNSASTSSFSPSNSSGEAQSRTDRIVFKLFGKDPSDFPIAMRKQIIDWLSNSPTEIESYIRPGCVILTIYLRMDKSIWDELCCDLSSSLRKLLDASSDSFWKTGWIYTRVQNRVAFVFNGQVVLDTPLPVKGYNNCRISSVKPIAVPVSKGAQFLVKGFNVSRSTARFLCALEGKYLVQGNCGDILEADTLVDQNDHNEIQSLSIPCSIPNVTGRGFIEVEDHGLSGSFFPFIVAEEEVCSEICTLESSIDLADTACDSQQEPGKLEARSRALDFIHDMGWLLHRSHLKFRLGSNSSCFPFDRFRWLIEFSVDRDWCAVVKKLLDILFGGIVDAGEHSSLEMALQDIGLLHRAVRGNCRRMVEALLQYCPDKGPDNSELVKTQRGGQYIFRPDAIVIGGLTPLHVVASQKGLENLLDVLTNDPGQVGVEAWKSARDSTGLTPNDYACLRGHYSYIHLIQKKTNTKPTNAHVVLDIPGKASDTTNKPKAVDGYKSSFQTEKQLATKPTTRSCRRCEQKLQYGTCSTSLAIYRPAMLSMVAIAAICVCVALLFKSSPEVLYVFQPFRWELLKYGSS